MAGDATYTITINVAAMGHPKTDGTVSKAGNKAISLPFLVTVVWYGVFYCS